MIQVLAAVGGYAVFTFLQKRKEKVEGEIEIPATPWQLHSTSKTPFDSPLNMNTPKIPDEATKPKQEDEISKANVNLVAGADARTGKAIVEKFTDLFTPTSSQIADASKDALFQQSSKMKQYVTDTNYNYQDLSQFPVTVIL